MRILSSEFRSRLWTALAAASALKSALQRRRLSQWHLSRTTARKQRTGIIVQNFPTRKILCPPLISRALSSSSRFLNSPEHVPDAARHLMQSFLPSFSATECRSRMQQDALQSGAAVLLLCLIPQTTTVTVRHGATHSSKITQSTVSVCI